ncbi:MUC15 protein, partial [Rhinopomastus cyanomelas]|nr:MUC15 protein [Rhinopomastus cyanomelas]
AQPVSQEVVLPTTTATSPCTTSGAASGTASAKANARTRAEESRWPDNAVPQSVDGTALSPDVTTASTDRMSNPAANSSRIPTSSPSFTTTGDFSRATESAAAASGSTTVPSNSTVPHSSGPAVTLPSETSASNPTTFFSTRTNLTSPTVKQDTPTSSFSPVQQTTELNQTFSNVSMAPPYSKDANENKTNKGVVIGGVVVGAILGSILISLIGYLMCGKKRSESFSHRRLYDDTRSDPVLHLDKSLEPYETSFGCASDDRTSRADKEEEDNTGWPSGGIPMANMAPSDLSL